MSGKRRLGLTRSERERERNESEWWGDDDNDTEDFDEDVDDEEEFEYEESLDEEEEVEEEDAEADGDDLPNQAREPARKRRRLNTMSGAAHFHAQLQMMKHVSDLGLLFPGVGGQPRVGAIVARLETGDDGETYAALNELCNLLSMASEDTLVGFRAEQVVPALLRVMQNHAEQTEIMLLALRTLSHMLDALPNTTPVVVNSGAIPLLVEQLLSVQVIDCAELALLSLEKLSAEHPQALLREGCMGAMLMFFDFFSIVLQRKIVTSIGNMVKNATVANFSFIEDCVSQLTNLLNYEDPRLVEGVCLAFYRAAVTFQSHETILVKLGGGTGETIRHLVGLLSRDRSLATGTMFSLVLKTLSIFVKRSIPLALCVMNENMAATLYGLLRGQAGEVEHPDKAGEVKNAKPMFRGVAAGTLAEAVDLLEQLLPRLHNGLLSEIHVDTALRGGGVSRVTHSSSSGSGSADAPGRANSSGARGTSNIATVLAQPGEEEDEEDEEDHVPDSGSFDEAPDIAANSPQSPMDNPDTPVRTPITPDTIMSPPANSPTAYNHTERVNLYTSDPAFMEAVAHDVAVLIDVYTNVVHRHTKAKVLSALTAVVTYTPGEILSRALKDVALSSFIAHILTTGMPKSVVTGLHLTEALMSKLPGIFKTWFVREGVVVEVGMIASGERVVGGDTVPATLPPPELSTPGKTSAPTHVTEIANAAQRILDTHFPEGTAVLRPPPAIANAVASLRGWRSQDALYYKKAVEELCGVLVGSDGITTYEFVHSHLPAALNDFLGSADEGNASRIARARAFLEVVVAPVPGAPDGESHFTRLVKKTVATLGHCERLPVYVTEHGETSGSGSGWGGSLKLLSQPFRLMLECEDAALGGPASMTVLIEPLATVSAVEEFIATKVAGMRGLRSGRQRGPPMTTGNEETRTFAEHPQHPLANVQHHPSRWTCDKCGVELRGPGPVRWRCGMCDFDLCEACAARSVERDPMPSASASSRSQRGGSNASGSDASRGRGKTGDRGADDARRRRSYPSSSQEASTPPPPPPQETGATTTTTPTPAKSASSGPGGLLWHLRRDKKDKKGDKGEGSGSARGQQQPAPGTPEGSGSEPRASGSSGIGSPLDGINRLRGMVSRGVGRKDKDKEKATGSNTLSRSTSATASTSAGGASASSSSAGGGNTSGTTTTTTAAGSQPAPAATGVSLSLNGKALPPGMTIFQAIHEYGGWVGHGQAKGTPGSTEAEVVHSTRAIWGQVYKLAYRGVSGGAGGERDDPADEDIPGEAAGGGDRGGPRAGAGDLVRMQYAGPAESLLPAPAFLHACDAELEVVQRFPELVDAATRELLRLLVLLHGLAAGGRAILGDRAGVHSGDGDGPLPSDAVFVSPKLNNKIIRQIFDALLLCTGHPGNSWCRALLVDAPFLVTFCARMKFFELTCFSPSRAITRLQEILADRGEEPKHKLGRIHKQKIRLERDGILDSARRIMDRYGSQKAYLEFEFFGEVGTGQGPTMEFYTLVSEALMQESRGLWNCEAETNHGVFPVPTNAKDPKLPDKIAMARLFGQFVGRAMYDRRIIDLPMSNTLLKVLRGDPVFLDDLRYVCPVKHKICTQLNTLVMKRDALLAEGVSRNAIEEQILLDGAKIADLCLDFTCFNYGEICEGGADKEVTVWNMDEYVRLSLETVFKRGCEQQVAAMLEGMNQAFPLRQLSFFSLAELNLILCGSSVKLTPQALEEATICDHGYTHTSRAVTMLFDILSSFTDEECRAFFTFVTGAPRLPVGGLKLLKPHLTIVRKTADSGLSPDQILPSVMTCQNYLKLPDYSSPEIMRSKLILAMREGANAFHLS